MTTKVDFHYAFATPHRMTVARPDSSDKTLLDLEPGRLRLAWTYDNLLSLPLAAFVTPPTTWSVKLHPQVDGQDFAKSAWTRSEGILPVLENTYGAENASMRIEVAGGATASIARVTMSNTGTANRRFTLQCDSERGFFGYNPAYVDPDAPRDCLLAGWGDRADRIIVMAAGADAYEVRGAVILCPVWDVKPGETRTGWLIRPYRSYAADLPVLRTTNWEAELEEAKAEWRTLLGRATRIELPDPGVTNGFYACLGDLFIMREPVAKGYIAAVPGTEGYRAPNSGEASILAIALDQVGLHKESALGYQMCLDLQGENGDWNDPQGWGHLMWAMAGFKSWAAMEHYRLTRDRDYLAAVYPRMQANSRWQEKQRARTRVLNNGERPLTYGLMPRGMGDCGLKDGDDLYGVFLPHNMWAVYADKVAVEAAEILGKTAEAEELRANYTAALNDLMQALERGAIAADGYRWIPGVPGKTCGSRWGALNALFPCGLLPRDHELITGTMRYIEANMSPGGLPLNTGWLANGMWVAIALDNLAEVHLVRDEGDTAADLLHATLNHGTPLYTWCEERGPEPGATQVTGDRQHLWTPVAVVRAIRDSLVMEDGGGLHLARGTYRDWLASGRPIGIADAPTHFGPVSFTMHYDATSKRAVGKAVFPGESGPAWAILHLRLPKEMRVTAIDGSADAVLQPDGSGIRWERPVGERTFEAIIE